MFQWNDQWAGKKVISHLPQNTELLCLLHMYSSSVPLVMFRHQVTGLVHRVFMFLGYFSLHWLTVPDAV